MRILYIEARHKKIPPSQYFIDKNFIAQLPRQIFLAYSIQFKEQAEVMKSAIEKSGRQVKGFQQVLGCTKLKTQYPIILIGQGRFHALNLAVQNPKNPLIIYSNGSSLAIGRRELEEYNKKKQAALSLFFSSNNIGIIVSTKPGQEKLKESLELARKIEKKYPEKKAYMFASSNVNIAGLENFSIGSWINSACPGLADDSSKILNIEDVLGFL
jgi:diphthamide biosynthesis enzyme Dph1/Dph2-like protein